MPGSGMSGSKVKDILAALTERGADPSCPSCQSLDWSGWDVGAIPRYNAESGHVDWAHGLSVAALICNRCGYLRLHAPSKLDRA
jgi:hypothetical protein